MKTITKIIIALSLVLNIILGFLFYNARLANENYAQNFMSKDKIIDMCKKYSSNISILRRLFPEYVVYLDGNEVIVEKARDEIIPNSYNWNYLSKNSRGIITFNDPNTVTYQGVDVSRYSENVDWKLVREDGIDFAMLRFGYRGYTKGMLNLDEYFYQNYEGCVNNGIKVGVYFFSQAITEEEAIEEANFVLEGIKGLDIRYPIAYDFEIGSHEDGRAENISKEQLIANTKAFLNTIEDAGYRPMIYGGSHYLLSKSDDYLLNNYDIWFAHYADVPYYPYRFTMWQYTESGTVNGISNNCDRNISFKDYD